ncbi:uncharacterized protein [Engystomops pustulosus]|uniref:uncharacterized protein isoform X1 n=1 Tax=Engystomops pustulosus TaxID=76066 RepID=UPI003AFA76B7
MAPSRKKQRVQVIETEQSINENTSSGSATPLSILKGTLSTNETEQLNLRRQTYFIQRADTSDENEPCIIYHGQVEDSNTDKTRRLTYVIGPCTGQTESPVMNCNPGIELTHSEMEIAEIQLQSPTMEETKPKKRGGRKKKSAPVLSSEHADDNKEKENLISKAPAGGKPRKRGQKKSASNKEAQDMMLASENGKKTSSRKKKAQDEKIETNVQKKTVKRGKKRDAD